MIRANLPIQGNSDGLAKLDMSTTRAKGRNCATSNASKPPKETPTSQQGCSGGIIAASRGA
ncbi:hypothetical protein GCM10027044_17050 [Hymenobacter ruber]